MKKQIATAAVIGALLALACLLWEQQSVAWATMARARALYAQTRRRSTGI
ncbi:hypothetical protein LJR022_010144 [Paraburkholderia hospita]